MTNYWECTQCKNWQQGQSAPDQCNNCTNPDFERVPEITATSSAIPSFDLEGLTAMLALLVFLNLATIPMGPLLNNELNGNGEIVALGAVVGLGITGLLMYLNSTKSPTAWWSAVVVFSINAVGVVVMLVETLAGVALLSSVKVFGNSVLLLLRVGAGIGFVEVFKAGTSPLAAALLWLVLTALPLGMLANGRDQIIYE